MISSWFKRFRSDAPEAPSEAPRPVPSEPAPRQLPNLQHPAGGTQAPSTAETPAPQRRGFFGRNRKPEPELQREPEISDEQRVGISEGMDHEAIKSVLAEQYRRYNRACSSLKPDLRREAEEMLESIVRLREKYFGL